MNPNQNRKRDEHLGCAISVNKCCGHLPTQTVETHLVEVDGHGAVAHFRGFMIGVADGWECHPSGSRPHRHAQSVTRWLSWGGGVAHHQTLPLQHDRFCVILAVDLWGPPMDEKQQSNKKDQTGSKVWQRGKRWTGHSSEWCWALGAGVFYSQNSDNMATTNLQRVCIFLECTSL